MSDLDRHLADLGPSDPIAGLIRDVAAQRSVFSDRRHNYISLRPALEGAIAAQAYVRRLWVALEPHEADTRLSRSPGGVQVRRRSSATTELEFDETHLVDQYSEVLDAVLWSLDWRAGGPRMTLGPDRQQRPARIEKFCPKCRLPYTPSGACGGGCD